MRFDLAIREAGYIPMSGQIIDASLVSAPKQRNTDAEKNDVKEGRIPRGRDCQEFRVAPRVVQLTTSQGAGCRSRSKVRRLWLGLAAGLASSANSIVQA